MTQATALSILKTGKNVFLTGEPGSGKTHTINTYVAYLREHGIEPAITASTGIAATHIGGMTIHSWSGIGIAKSLSKDDAEVIATRKRIAARLKRTRVLIIDEVSMLDAKTLDAAEAVCRAGKQNALPWGGMQVVLVGDFFQLPPVARVGEEPPKFSFCASAWKTANPTICYLSEQYRQDDMPFLSMLESIRRGTVNENTHAGLASRNLKPNIESNHTRLYSHNADVDRINNEKLNALPEEEKTYAMVARGPQRYVEQLKRGCLSPERLRLKVGTQVMCTKNNFEKGFVNGTIGVVKAFTEEEDPVVQTRDGKTIIVTPMEWSITDGPKTLAKIIQTPLRLAWAITVHKSQGMTLDEAVVDLRHAFEYGQGYVALSRLRTLQGLFLNGYNQRSLEVHPEILETDIELKKQSHREQERFTQLSREERTQQEQSFIEACGGTLEIAPKKQDRRTASAKTGRKETTYDKTLALWKQGEGIDSIARIRGLTRETVITHFEELLMRGELERDVLRKAAPPYLLDVLPEIEAAFEELGTEKLAPVFHKLEGAYSYNDLRLARILCTNS